MSRFPPLLLLPPPPREAGPGVARGWMTARPGGSGPAVTGHCRWRPLSVIPGWGLPIICIIVTPDAGERQLNGGDPSGGSWPWWRRAAAATEWCRAEGAAVGCRRSSRGRSRAGRRRRTPQPRWPRSRGGLVFRAAIATARAAPRATLGHVSRLPSGLPGASGDAPGRRSGAGVIAVRACSPRHHPRSQNGARQRPEWAVNGFHAHAMT